MTQFVPPVTLTFEIYKASKPPAVRALFDMPSGAERDTLAHQLAAQGYLLDVPIDVWNWGVVSTMWIRQTYGFTWQPSALMAPLPPGEYPVGPVPPGAIKVSTDAKDYPPFEPPAVKPPPDTRLVGRLLFGNLYTYNAAALVDGKYQFANGEVVTQDGVQYRAIFTAFAVGTTVYFERLG